MDAILLSVDHMRAFDIIEWSYIFKVLQYFNVCPVFIDWLKIIYCPQRIKSFVQVNGHVSNSFYPTRGIRQGCPLSPFLYVLVSETLTQYFRKMSFSFKGLQILGNEYKITNYADDTNFFVKDFSSVSKILDVYKVFQRALGPYSRRRVNGGLA